MKDSVSLRFLYKTVPGRMLLKLLVQPWVSKAAGCFLSSGCSKGLVPYYIRKHNIDMNGISIPKGGFSSFNSFFTRKRPEEYRALPQKELISPCDGYLHVVKIKKDVVLEVKHSGYSLGDLLKDSGLAKKFEDGTALIFRLTPSNYHRYCYPADGNVLISRRIKGKLHCVRPIALRTTPVFIQNSREYQVVKTKQFGMMVQMEVGALLVGKISNHKSLVGSYVQAGKEKGYFEFGGSTVILLFQKDSLTVNEELMKRQDEEEETPVRMGDVIAWGR